MKFCLFRLAARGRNLEPRVAASGMVRPACHSLRAQAPGAGVSWKSLARLGGGVTTRGEGVPWRRHQGGNGAGGPSDAPGPNGEAGSCWGADDLLKNRSLNYRRGQIRTVMSKLPETTDPPSGRKQTERTVRRCPLRLATTCMEAASITFTSLS